MPRTIAPAALLLGLLVWPVARASAEELAAIDGLEKLSDEELDGMHGGFAAPGGLLIAVGLEIAASTTSLAGDIISSVAANQPALAASATLARVNGDPAIVNLVRYAPTGVTAIVQNELNNVMVQEVTRLSIDVANYTQLHNQLTAMGPVAGGMVTGLPR